MKRKIGKLAAYMLALSLLAGCGKTPSVTTSPAPSETPKTSEASETPKTSETATSESTSSETANEEKLTFWIWGPESLEKGFVEGFAAEHPNVKVEVWRGEQSDYEKKLQPAMSAGEGPDVVCVQTGGMLNQYAPFLEPLDGYLDKSSPTWKDQYSPDVLKQVTTEDGSISALPINLSGCEFVLYNKTIFDKYGLKPPATYEEWKTIADTLKKNDVIPAAFGAKDVWADCDMFVSISNQFAPGKVYEAEAGTAKWTDPAFVDTMNAWKKMFDDGIFQEGALGVATYPDARDIYYYQGKSAMFMTGSWHVSYFLPGGEKFGTAIEKDETGAFILPQIGPNPSRAIASVDTAIAVNKDAKNKDLAVEFVKYVTMGGGQNVVANTLQGSPAIKGVQVSTETLDKILFPAEKEAVQYVNEKMADSIGKRTLGNTELNNAISVAMQEVAVGKDVNQALKDIQAVADTLN